MNDILGNVKNDVRCERKSIVRVYGEKSDTLAFFLYVRLSVFFSVYVHQAKKTSKNRKFQISPYYDVTTWVKFSQMFSFLKNLPTSTKN